LRLSVHNEMNRNPPASFELKIYSNASVMKLRKEIAKRFEVDYKNIRITRVNLLSFNNDIPDSDNGKILSDISLSNFEYLEVRKKNIPKKEKMK